jgi:hypothetical protein
MNTSVAAPIRVHIRKPVADHTESITLALDRNTVEDLKRRFGEDWKAGACHILSQAKF